MRCAATCVTAGSPRRRTRRRPPSSWATSPSTRRPSPTRSAGGTRTLRGSASAGWPPRWPRPTSRRLRHPHPGRHPRRRPGPSDDDLPSHDRATMCRLFPRPMPNWADREAVAKFAAAAETLGDSHAAARFWDRTPDTAPPCGWITSWARCTPGSAAHAAGASSCPGSRSPARRPRPPRPVLPRRQRRGEHTRDPPARRGLALRFRGRPRSCRRCRPRSRYSRRARRRGDLGCRAPRVTASPTRHI